MYTSNYTVNTQTFCSCVASCIWCFVIVVVVGFFCFFFLPAFSLAPRVYLSHGFVALSMRGLAELVFCAIDHDGGIESMGSVSK